MSTTFSRRSILRSTSLAAGAAAAYTALPRTAWGQDAAPTPTTTASVNLGEGGTEITIWVQDHGASIAQYQNAAQRYVENGADVTVTVQPIPFNDMLPKLLPSIAAGTEADIMMGYTDFYVGTDVTRLFLRLDDAMGGREMVDQTFLPVTLGAIDLPQGSVYYLPTASGLNGAAVTVNRELFSSEGIEFSSISTWEDLMGVARDLTVVENGTITRAGLNFAGLNGSLEVIKSWIWQLGGEFYDQESGTWSLATSEGEAAFQLMWEVYNGDSPVNSFDIITNDTDDLAQGRLACHLNGAFAISNTEALYPDFDADGFPTPQLGAATVDVVYPGHMSVATLSRRLADDDGKREHCVGILNELFTLDYRLAQLDVYSGAVLDKRVYEDERIADHQYGEVSKSIADSVLARARYPKDHVANQVPARDELVRALRNEISAQEALQNADEYLNAQEQDARERIGL